MSAGRTTKITKYVNLCFGMLLLHPNKWSVILFEALICNEKRDRPQVYLKIDPWGNFINFFSNLIRQGFCDI
jgi:hypothetical protein